MQLFLVVAFFAAVARCQQDFRPSSSPIAQCTQHRSAPHFWSAEFRSCLPCKPCVRELAPCTDTADAICGDADDALMDEREQGMARLLEVTRRRSGSGVAKVRESVLNAAQNKDEFLTGLRERMGLDGDDASLAGDSSAIRGINARLQKEDRRGGDEVDGKVRYSAGESRRRDSLHSDLQEIERALLSGDDELPTPLPPSKKRRRKNRVRQPPPPPRTEKPSLDPTPTPTPTTTEAATTEPDPYTLIVLGKKRLYAAPPPPPQSPSSSSSGSRLIGSGIDLTGEAEEPQEEEPKEVFGAVRRDPNAFVDHRQNHDEFGIIHKILTGAQDRDGNSNESTDSSSSSSSSSSTFLGSHGSTLLWVALLVFPAAALVGAAAAVTLLRRYRHGAAGAGGGGAKDREFKILDNNGGFPPSPTATATTGNGGVLVGLTASHSSSSFRRSTDSRLTAQTTAPNSPSREGLLITSPLISPNKLAGGTMSPPPIFDSLAVKKSPSSTSPSSSSGSGHQLYLSYVDEHGRTGVVKSSPSPVRDGGVAIGGGDRSGGGGNRELPV